MNSSALELQSTVRNFTQVTVMAIKSCKQCGRGDTIEINQVGCVNGAELGMRYKTIWFKTELSQHFVKVLPSHYECLM